MRDDDNTPLLIRLARAERRIVITFAALVIFAIAGIAVVVALQLSGF